MISSLQSILSSLLLIALSLSAQVGLLTQSVNSSSQLASVATTNSLVGYWNFDENTGITANDTSGSGNNGQLLNGASWTAGKIGSAIQFNGADSKVLTGNPSLLNFGAGQDFTISLWIKGSDTTQAQKIISKRSSTPDGYQLRFNNPTSLIWRVDEPVTITDTIAPTHPLNGAWRHIVTGRNGSQHFLYIDGVLVKSSTDSTSDSLQNTESLTIGNDQGSAEGFNGAIDEVRIYNRGLTSQEILDIYNDNGVVNPPIDTTAPTVPTGLSATTQSTSQINLSWSASTDTVGVTGYKIFRGGSQVGTSVGTSYNDTGLNTSTQYSYTVSAYDAAGNNSAQSSSVSATTQAVTPPPTSATISLNPAITYQTMVGWETTTFADQGSATFPNYSDRLFDEAVSNLGINRVRLEIRSGAENSTDYWSQLQNGTITAAQWRCYRYSQINDNSNSNSINPSGFQFSEIDDNINKIVVPLRQKLQARGEYLYINLDYVSFTPQITGAGCPSGLTFFHNTNPSEYAEFVLATYQHMQSKYGFVPDSWEVVLEPDNTIWTATQMGQAIVAAGDLLLQNGFTPKFVAPSTTNGPNAINWFNSIVAVPGASNYISEVSYHRYVNIDNTNLATLASRAAQFGKFPAMLEWIGVKYTTLHDDLKVGNNSSWSQYVLAGPSTNADDGGKYFLVDSTNPTNPTIIMGSRTKFLRQYFKYIRSGAVRINATTANATFDPVAFRNTNGNYVVVVKALAGGNFSVGNLPAGTYGIFYTTGDGITATQYDVQLADQVISSGELISTNIPAAGAITIYAKSGSVPPPIMDTTAPIISSISSSGVTQNGAIISWSTNESSDTQVEYGTTLSYGQSTTLNSSLVTSHNVSLSGLSANTTYNYRVKSRDAAGNLAVTTNQTFTTSASVSVPVISSFTASPTSITSGQSSTLSWGVTGATSVSINQSIGTVTGTSRSVSPTVTTIYTLTATNAQGSVTSNTTVTVGTVLPPVTGNVFYVAPNGSSSGNGSITNPWDMNGLNTNKASVPAGSTVYLRGGRYVGNFNVSLNGTVAAPIKVRSYPGEWAVFDGYDPSVTLTSAVGTNGSNSVTVTATVSDTSKLRNGGSQSLENEEIYITNINAATKTITFLRGWGASAIVAHPIGAIIQPHGGTVIVATGSNTWLMDFEVMSSDPVRQTSIAGSGPVDIHRSSGIDINGDGIKLINLVIHDVVNGIFTYDTAKDVEVNGVLTYSNGWWGPDRGHGHGMYVRNGSGTLHKYNDVISFDNYATGQKVFGYQAHGEDVHFDGFVGFNNEEGNFFVGLGSFPLKNIEVKDSYIYSPNNSSGRRGGSGMMFGWSGVQNLDVVIQNNYIAGRNGGLSLDLWQSMNITGNTIWSSGNGIGSTMFKITPGTGRVPSDYTIDNNTYYDNDNGSTTYNFGYPAGPNTVGGGNYNYTKDWKRTTTFDVNSTYVLGTAGGVPNVDKYFVKPNAYELGRANIVVYNWSQANSVSVNVASAGLSVGDSYEIRDAQNYLGTPIATGVYNGGNINIPMTSTAVYPAIGNLFFAPVHTSKEFGVFVIRKQGGSTTTPPPVQTDTTAPTIPINISATTISSSQINLSWTASTDAVGVTGYKIYRGGTQIATSVTNSYSNTGLTPATTYNYTVSAYDAAGNNSAQSASVNATTQSLLDTTAPTLSNISASGITTTGATIGWTTNENADTQVDYGITTSYGQSTILNTTLLTAHSATLSGLSPQTTYNYRVRSKDAAGNSSVSSNNTFTTVTAPDTTAPSAVSNLSTANVTESSAVLSWTSPGNDGNIGTANAYDIRYSTTPITALNWTNAVQATGVPTPQISGTTQTYTLVGLSPATTYYTALKTSDVVGNIALISNVPTFTTTAASLTPDITAPTVVLTAPANSTVISGSSVNISATATDPSTPGAVTSGIANVVFKVDGVTIVTDTTSPYTAVLSTLPLTNGTHTITARSTDVAGNLSIITSINVTVSNAIIVPPAPTLTVALSANPNTGTAPLSGVSLSAVLSGTATGNTTYYFYCNRGDTTTSTSTSPDVKSVNDPLTTKTIASLCSYPTAGTYTAKVIVERNGLVSTDRANIIIAPKNSNPGPINPPAGSGGGGGVTSGSVLIPAFSANAFDKQVNLVWKNPTDLTFARALIVRNQGTAPASPTDGTKVYEGNASSFVDTNLQNDQTYFYSIFAVTLSGTDPKPSRSLSATPKAGLGQTQTIISSTQPQPQQGATVAQYVFARILAIGMKNVDVENLQRILGVEVTGYFGILTQQALGQFQIKNGIATPGSEGYGQAGPRTRQVLNALFSTTTPVTSTLPPVSGGTSFTTLLRIGVKNNQVTLLQQLLAKNPTLYPEGLVTGYFGPATSRAVGRFQVKYGIASPGNPGYGQVGPLTRKTLNSVMK